jgi:hypothetical protein
VSERIEPDSSTVNAPDPTEEWIAEYVAASMASRALYEQVFAALGLPAYPELRRDEPWRSAKTWFYAEVPDPGSEVELAGGAR